MRSETRKTPAATFIFQRGRVAECVGGKWPFIDWNCSRILPLFRRGVSKYCELNSDQPVKHVGGRRFRFVHHFRLQDLHNKSELLLKLPESLKGRQTQWDCTSVTFEVSDCVVIWRQPSKRQRFCHHWTWHSLEEICEFFFVLFCIFIYFVLYSLAPKVEQIQESQPKNCTGCFQPIFFIMLKKIAFQMCHYEWMTR